MGGPRLTDRRVRVRAPCNSFVLLEARVFFIQSAEF